MDKVKCTIFFCNKRHGKYCCALCPNPCDNQCLNHPDRCKLAKAGSPVTTKRQKLSEEQVIELRRLILEGKMSGEKIAEKVGCSTATVVWHRDRLRLKGLLGEKKK